MNFYLERQRTSSLGRIASTAQMKHSISQLVLSLPVCFNLCTLHVHHSRPAEQCNKFSVNWCVSECAGEFVTRCVWRAREA